MKKIKNSENTHCICTCTISLDDGVSVTGKGKTAIKAVASALKGLEVIQKITYQDNSEEEHDDDK